MLTIHGETINHTDPYRHKFGDALAEYVWADLLAGGWDTVAGYSDADLGESFDRVTPRKILACDSRGFVDLWRFDTVAAADAAWQEIGERFAAYWEDETE